MNLQNILKKKKGLGKSMISTFPTLKLDLPQKLKHWQRASVEKEVQDSQGHMEMILTRWVYNLLFFN